MSAQIVLALRILAVVLLYIFLFGFIYIAWKSVFPIMRKSASNQKLILKNIITKAVFASKSREIYIGRSEDADLKVDDESISNLHSRFYWKNMQWWVEDLDSTNGTFLNDERLVSPELVNSSDHIRCGATEFEIQISNKEESIMIKGIL